jgi:hypothetical protein
MGSDEQTACQKTFVDLLSGSSGKWFASWSGYHP